MGRFLFTLCLWGTNSALTERRFLHLQPGKLTITFPFGNIKRPSSVLKLHFILSINYTGQQIKPLWTGLFFLQGKETNGKYI